MKRTPLQFCRDLVERELSESLRPFDIHLIRGEPFAINERSIDQAVEAWLGMRNLAKVEPEKRGRAPQVADARSIGAPLLLADSLRTLNRAAERIYAKSVEEDGYSMYQSDNVQHVFGTKPIPVRAVGSDLEHSLGFKPKAAVWWTII